MIKKRTDEPRYVRAVQERTRKYVEELLKENERLQSELAAIAAQHARHTEEYVLVEEQNANLANLYVASYRLHGTVERTEVLTAIQEIIINLIGSEEHAVFAVDDRGMQLLASFGVDRARFESVPLGKGIVGHVGKTGAQYFASEAPPPVTPTKDEEDLTVCVPLVLDREVIGVIAIFRLLPQKAALEATDHDLIDLLATQAATALAFTDLYKRRPGKSA